MSKIYGVVKPKPLPPPINPVVPTPPAAEQDPAAGKLPTHPSTQPLASCSAFKPPRFPLSPQPIHPPTYPPIPQPLLLLSLLLPQLVLLYLLLLLLLEPCLLQQEQPHPPCLWLL